MAGGDGRLAVDDVVQLRRVVLHRSPETSVPVELRFQNSPNALGVAKDSSGDISLFSCANGKVAFTPMPAPQGRKKPLFACPGGPGSSIFIFDGLWWCIGAKGANAKLVSKAPESVPKVVAPTPDGVVSLSDRVYLLKSDGFVAVAVADLPAEVADIVQKGDLLYILAGEGTLYSVAASGGTATPLAQDCRGIACKFDRFFAAGRSGLTVRQ